MLVARREHQVRVGGVEDEIGVRAVDEGLERLGLAREGQRVISFQLAPPSGILRHHALRRVRPGDQDPVAVVRRDGEGLHVVAGLFRRPARAVVGRAVEADAVDRRPDLARRPTHVDLEHAAGGQARELAPGPALVGRAEQPLRGAEVEVAVRRPAHDVEPVAELRHRQRLAGLRPGLPAVGRLPERAVLRRRPLRHPALEGVPFPRRGRAAGDLHEGELHEARGRLAVRALGRARDVVELLHQGEAVAAVGREVDAGMGVPARQEPARRGRVHHQDAVAVLAVDGAALAGDADLEPEARRALPPVAEIVGADRDVDVLHPEEPVGPGRRIAPGAEELEAAAADDLLLELLLRAVDERQPARRGRRHRHLRARRRPGALGRPPPAEAQGVAPRCRPSRRCSRPAGRAGVIAGRVAHVELPGAAGPGGDLELRIRHRIRPVVHSIACTVSPARPGKRSSGVNQPSWAAGRQIEATISMSSASSAKGVSSSSTVTWKALVALPPEFVAVTVTSACTGGRSGC